MAASDFSETCPKDEKAVELLGKRWTALILRSLIEGPRRFTKIKAYVEGVSDRLLSERLQEMEEAGVVVRRVQAQRPVLIEYSLTAKGADLRRVVEAIQGWADQWEPEAEAKEAGVRR